MVAVHRAAWPRVLLAVHLAGCGGDGSQVAELDDAGQLVVRPGTGWQGLVDRHAPQVAERLGLPWREEVFGVELDAATLRDHLAGRHLRGHRVPAASDRVAGQQAEAEDLAASWLGFFDPAQPRAVYFLADVPAAARPEVVRHELAHALQHQHFDVPALVAEAAGAGQDAALALAAVLEGQASLVQDGWGAAAPQSPRNPRLDAEALWHGRRSLAVAPAGGVAAGPAQVAADLAREALGACAVSADSVAPDADARVARALRAFPYAAGRSFVATLARRSSLAAAVHRTLQRPPRSTRELLHPEVYLAGVVPEPVPTAALEAAWGRPAQRRDSVGEWSTALRLGGDADAFAVAACWRGDVRLADPHGEGAVWVSLWHNEAAARAFAVAIAPTIRGRGPDALRVGAAERPHHTPATVRWVGRAAVVVEAEASVARAWLAAVTRDLAPLGGQREEPR